MTVTFASTLADDLAPWLTSAADPSGAYAIYLNALAQMFEGLFGLSMDQGDDPDSASYTFGWEGLLDVDACPSQYLGYLAQFNGTALPAGTDPVTARQIIRSESGQARGTPAAILSAAKRNLTGTQSCILVERTAADGSTPDAYHFLLLIRPSELVSLAALQTAVDAVKPAGVFYTVVQSTGMIWQQETHTWATDTQTWAQKG